MPQIEYTALGAFALFVVIVMIVQLVRLFGRHRKRATLCDDAWLTHDQKSQGRCSWHGGVAKDE